MKKSSAVIGMLTICAIAACSYGASEPAAHGGTSAGNETAHQGDDPIDAAFCARLSEVKEPPFENAKACYMAACEGGDQESCDLAGTYNGNLVPGDTTLSDADAAAQFIDNMSRARTSDPDAMLAPYMEAGLIDREPDVAADYGFFYRVRGAASFLGYPLLAFETQSMRAAGFIGCCIDEGVSILVRTDGDDAAAKQFAARQGCRLRADDSSRMANFVELGLAGYDPADQRYQLISCHENDRE